MPYAICENGSCPGQVEFKDDKNVLYCPECGRRLITTCPNKHDIRQAGQKHCVECGEELRPKPRKSSSSIRPAFAEME